MRRSRRRTRKRSRRQRGGFLDALKAGLNNGLGMFGLKKKEQPVATATPTTHSNLSPPDQVGGKRRRRKSRRRKSRRRKSRRRKSRRKRRRRTKRRR